MDISNLRQKCEEAGQSHLLQFWDQLSEDQQKALIFDISQINLQQALEYFKEAEETLKEDNEKVDDHIEALEQSVCGSVARSSHELLQSYRDAGLKAVSNNEVAVLLLAGGQGTRLGVPYPKGMYDVGLPSGKTLYQLQAERIIKLERLAKQATGSFCTVPWYIMTSEHTKDATESFFQKHDYFGLNKENVIIFEQSQLPCFDFNGKIILDSKFKVSLAPGGNGGLYEALREEGALNDLIARKIKYVHVYCVDNILVKMADPVFVGFCLSKNAECGAKVVEKAAPNEAVGVVCKVSGKYQVVEYSEISQKASEKRTEDGRLVFSAGNICNHFFTVNFLKRVCLKENETQLKHHIAKKKIPFVDSTGQQQKPSSPNGIKMEKFVFDVFQFAQNLAVWEVIREDEFSPLKNADGPPKDTPTTCREDLLNLHNRLIVSAGGRFLHSSAAARNNNSNENADSSQKNVQETERVVCEISPLVSYFGEGLEDLRSQDLVPPVLIELAPDGINLTIKQGPSQ